MPLTRHEEFLLLVCHAPSIPDWFKPTMEAAPEVRPSLFDLSHEDREDYNNEVYYEDCSDTLKAFIDQCAAFEKAEQQYRDMYEVQRTLQWPTFWANAQTHLITIAEEKKPA